VFVLAPPPRQAPATLLLARRADAWLVLAALGRTRGEEARQLAEDLEGVTVRPLGVVLAEPAEGKGYT
jgi:Mrp family chromosome partitioning ATPase